ncbi:MAG: hypothetical protein ACK4UN_15800 [Limisphaerales bacterium]
MFFLRNLETGLRWIGVILFVGSVILPSVSDQGELSFSDNGLMRVLLMFFLVFNFVFIDGGWKHIVFAILLIGAVCINFTMLSIPSRTWSWLVIFSLLLVSTTIAIFGKAVTPQGFLALYDFRAYCWAFGITLYHVSVYARPTLADAQQVRGSQQPHR